MYDLLPTDSLTGYLGLPVAREKLDGIHVLRTSARNVSAEDNATFEELVDAEVIDSKP